jgi:hypothetical protein
MALQFIMQNQYYRNIGKANHTVALKNGTKQEYVFSQLVQPWPFPEYPTSPLGVGVDPGIIQLMAAVGSATIESARTTITKFHKKLITPPAANAAFSHCGADEVAIPGFNGGRNSVQCMSAGDLTIPIDEARIAITTPGVTIESAVADMPLQFVGKGSKAGCMRLEVEAPRFTIGEVTFDQSNCIAADKHASRIPIVLYGAEATDFTAVNIKLVTGVNVAVAALGGYTKTMRGAEVINVSGFHATVVEITPDPTALQQKKYCAAFARAYGVVYVNCSGTDVEVRNVLVQSVNSTCSVDVRSFP